MLATVVKAAGKDGRKAAALKDAHEALQEATLVMVAHFLANQQEEVYRS